MADPDLDPRTAVERILRQSARMQTDPEHPAGCLFVLSAASVAHDQQLVGDLLTARRQTVRDNLAACLRRAVDTGELAPAVDPAALAAAFETFLWGMSTEARDGVAPETLDLAIGHVMTMWDAAALRPLGPGT